jgi:hypothetical protein
VDDLDVRDYAVPVRTILAKLLLLVAVLLMPLGMNPAAAETGGREAMAAMPMGHCDRQAPRHERTHGFAECTMACSAALPAVDAAQDEPPPIVCLPAQPATAHVLDGLHAETATPPPKQS